jgi:hypothetical protein
MRTSAEQPPPTDSDRAGRPDGLTRRWIQGVEYLHSVPVTGGDLFLTRFGRPFAPHLQPENWFDPEWFSAHRRRLRGTSTIYQVQTKPIQGRTLNLIARFNRVGEHLPVDTLTRNTHANAEFNSPFEEIAQLLALRAARLGPERRRILTKRPLAVYSPPKRFKLWQTGRVESLMASQQARLRGFTLDITRQYILLYGWIKGIDVQDATDQFGMAGACPKSVRTAAMEEVEGDLAQAGFRVADMKPAHIVVRFTEDGALLRRRNGRLAYALIDYELLEAM